MARRLGAALIDQDTATAPLVAVVSELVGVSDLDDIRLAGPTRAARYETVIWIPTGDAADATRDPATFDAIARFLLECGAQVLDVTAEVDDASDLAPMLL